MAQTSAQSSHNEHIMFAAFDTLVYERCGKEPNVREEGGEVRRFGWTRCSNFVREGISATLGTHNEMYKRFAKCVAPPRLNTAFARKKPDEQLTPGQCYPEWKKFADSVPDHRCGHDNDWCKVKKDECEHFADQVPALREGFEKGLAALVKSSPVADKWDVVAELLGQDKMEELRAAE